MGPEIKLKTAVTIFYSIPVDRACDAFFFGSLLKDKSMVRGDF